MVIAIPAVTEYINNSRKNAYLITASNYIGSVRNKVNGLDYKFTDTNVTYYVPAKCIRLEKGGNSPYGEFIEGYVVVTFDDNNYRYYWTSYDTSLMGIELTEENKLKEEEIKTGMEKINKVGIEGREFIGVINENVCSSEPIISLAEDNNGVPIVIDKPVMTAIDFGDQVDVGPFLYGPLYKPQIKEIIIDNKINIPEGYDSWDISADRDESVMAWYDPVLVASNEAIVTIGGKGGVVANPNSMYLFSYLTNLTKIDLTYFDTLNVVNMHAMFAGTNKLLSLDVSKFDTSKVTDMSYMFNEYCNFKELDLSSFDTSKVTNMSYMFGGLSNLTSLDVSKFDTSKVTDMSGMFNELSKLTSLDLSKFDTSKVTNMASMFYYTGSSSTVFTLDLGNKFDTSLVTDMTSMFNGTGVLNPNFAINMKNLNFPLAATRANMFANLNASAKIYVKSNTIGTNITGAGFTGTVIDCSVNSCP